MLIYGAGLAGLLSANMLRKFSPTVMEAQSELPNNQSALLRFRSDRVGSACAIPFRKVGVHKAIKYDGRLITSPNLQLSNMYSQKVTGSILSRSINNLEPVDRYIAPLDLIQRMSVGIDIQYDSGLSSDSIAIHHKGDIWPEAPIISTIPMPALMKIVGWPDIPDFPHQQIWTQTATIDDPECDVYQTIYYPDPLTDQYRISVIGNVVISEFIREPTLNTGKHTMVALREDFGIAANKLVNLKQSSQKYGKIRPIDEALRKEFIYEMTEKYNIYSVGRFATWRQLLLDDVVTDIQHIENFINLRSSYVREMHKVKE